MIVDSGVHRLYCLLYRGYFERIGKHTDIELIIISTFKVFLSKKCLKISPRKIGSERKFDML
jgi:hypothetical protein